MTKPDRQSEYIHAPEIEFREIGGEAFLVAADGETMFNMNPTGAAMWRLLEEPTSPDEAAEILHEAFPMVDKARIDKDVDQVFGDLLRGGFIAKV